ncbi:MAG: 5'/3'-nucleotidase SurE, partial [Methanosarcinales archaeon]|nr:5'/3'-nucleotidase SurE [Methanosarcinales archaeon]
GDSIKNDVVGTDVYALLKKKAISITPVSLDPTALVEPSTIEKLL